ncbi:hypothetical protein [Dyella ginsengisoli]|uniref:hypothetical protein n=1 Tax=Dyella ginsengisoli TaxID=363848 RepID=UPI0005BD613C|nr:hypothetical protein [Dyella ginsengisoli]
MKAIETLLLVWAAGGVLSRTGDTLHLESRNKQLPPELKEAIRANKTELLAMLPHHERSPSHLDRSAQQSR